MRIVFLNTKLEPIKLVHHMGLYQGTIINVKCLFETGGGKTHGKVMSLALKKHFGISWHWALVGKNNLRCVNLFFCILLVQIYNLNLVGSICFYLGSGVGGGSSSRISLTRHIYLFKTQHSLITCRDVCVLAVTVRGINGGWRPS